jgi:hypothetical protein
MIPPRFFAAGSCLRQCLWQCRKLDIIPTQYIVLVQARSQTLWVVERHSETDCSGKNFQYYYTPLRTHRVSTSRFGVGQLADSKKTPLGLHRIEVKIGGGQPVGTVFKGRKPVGDTWRGMPDASIAHRILWLRGLDNGFNSGGNVDSFSRYIYIHGVGDETTLGHPASIGCVHMAANDLLPLFDRLPVGTLVHIG